MKKAEPPTTDSPAEKRVRRWAAVFAFVMSLALFAFSLSQGVFYAALNVSVTVAMAYCIARVR